jgi:hypothetical protein
MEPRSVERGNAFEMIQAPVVIIRSNSIFVFMSFSWFFIDEWRLRLT